MNFDNAETDAIKLVEFLHMDLLYPAKIKDFRSARILNCKGLKTRSS